MWRVHRTSCFEAGSVERVEAVHRADEGHDLDPFRLTARHAFGLEHHEHGSHREKVRHDVGDHSEVNERIELAIEGGLIVMKDMSV